MMTIAERERWAYANGNVQEAALLARIEDGDDDLAADLQLAREQLDAAEKEAEELKSLLDARINN